MRPEPFPLPGNQRLTWVTDNDAFFFNSTTSVQACDIVRGMIPKSTPFKEIDYMTYTDPNVPAGQCQLIRWAFGEANPNGLARHKMLGWLPFRSPAGPGC